jgi:O-antigen ligase
MTGGHAMVMQSWEIHNGHLNIAVESGLFGLLAFYALVIKALLHRWHNDFGKSTRAVRILTFTFLLAGMVFMIHNRLHRDRGFMLFMGLASAIALAAPSDPRRSGMPLQHGQPVLILRRTPKAN